MSAPPSSGAKRLESAASLRRERFDEAPGHARTNPAWAVVRTFPARGSAGLHVTASVRGAPANCAAQEPSASSTAYTCVVPPASLSYRHQRSSALQEGWGCV